MMSVSLPTLRAALVSAPFPIGFTIFGYQSEGDAAAFFRGELTLFAEIEEWLDDHLPDHRSMAATDDFHGTLHVAVPDDDDAVMFKLAWGDVILA